MPMRFCSFLRLKALTLGLAIVLPAGEPVSWERSHIELAAAPLDDAVTVTFVATNRTGAPILIRDAVSSCGCSYRLSRPATMAAGSTAAFAITMAIADRRASFSADLRVSIALASATMPGRSPSEPSRIIPEQPIPDMPPLTFRIAIPERPIASPGFVHWMMASPAATRSTTIRIPAGSIYRLTGSIDAPEGFHASLQPATAPGDWLLHIQPRTTAVATNARIILETTAGAGPGRPVVVHAHIAAAQAAAKEPTQHAAERSPDTNPVLTEAPAQPAPERDPNEPDPAQADPPAP